MTEHRVNTEVRGEVCVIHCGGVAGGTLAADLPEEVGRCLDTGASAVVVDLDPWRPIDDLGLAALRAAARAFESAGGSWSSRWRSRTPARRSPRPG